MSLAKYRRIESPDPSRTWYDVLHPDTGAPLGRVARWTGEAEWEGWVRYDSGELFNGPTRTVRYVRHELVSTGKTRETAVRAMWDFLP